MRVLLTYWTAIWPNLAANVIWWLVVSVPLLWLAHRRLTQHANTVIDRIYDKIRDDTEGPNPP